MTLGELVKVLPGYINLYVHNDNEAHSTSAGMIAYGELADCIIVKAVPISPYSMEVTINNKEESK